MFKKSQNHVNSTDNSKKTSTTRRDGNEWPASRNKQSHASQRSYNDHVKRQNKKNRSSRHQKRGGCSLSRRWRYIPRDIPRPRGTRRQAGARGCVEKAARWGRAGARWPGASGSPRAGRPISPRAGGSRTRATRSATTHFLYTLSCACVSVLCLELPNLGCVYSTLYG